MAKSSTASFSAGEVLKGYITLGATDFEAGFQEGHKANTYVVMNLKLSASDIHGFTDRPDHSAQLTGSVTCDALGGSLGVEDGSLFNLFVDTDNPWRKRMLYRVFLNGRSGPLTLSGFKVITDDPRYGVWDNCQSLYTKIFHGHVQSEEESSAKIHSAGVIFLYKVDFWKVDFWTFRIRGPVLKRVRGFFQFGNFFLGTLWRFRQVKRRGRQDVN